MSTMQVWLARAANQLNLQAFFSHKMALPDGRSIVAKAYFPHLSNPNGIVVVDWTDDIDAPTRRALESLGIGVSTFGEPGPDEKFNIGDYLSMFSEWGWTGPEEKRPAWMQDPNCPHASR